jgi:hypothetical protein
MYEFHIETLLPNNPMRLLTTSILCPQMTVTTLKGRITPPIQTKMVLKVLSDLDEVGIESFTPSLTPVDSLGLLGILPMLSYPSIIGSRPTTLA